MTTASLAEADLHCLVDGDVDANRRADLLRRLAASPADRALVECWQDQAELIRAAFRDVVQEALPVALDLAPPRLRSVDPDPLRPLRTNATVTAPVRHGGVAAMTAALLLITVGLAVSWMVGSRDDDASDPAPAAPPSAQVERAEPGTAVEASLPPLRIPDLAASGLWLAGVSSEAGEPARIVLRYRDGGTGRVTVDVSRNAPAVGAAPIAQAGKTLTWRSPSAAFTLAGTLSPERLRTIATRLRADQGSD